jgi:V-type H+-transporting ATPase subunit F
MTTAVAALAQLKKGDCLLSVIGDEDTVVGFLLAGMGHVDSRRTPNFFTVDSKTTPAKIEEVFRSYANNPDIAIILITQAAANEIRYLLDEYERVVPTVLEIPSKDNPYDSSKDSIVQRLKHMTGQE